MSPSEGKISHVSDTALMTAACRALETERPDGLVRDPFAARLAGERGMAIARSIPRLEILSFGVGIRSRFLDELVARTVTGQAIATVVSVGAGLDSRPYRLDLPPGLRWIEADFPAMLEYKSELLAAERPNCRLERMPADLANAGQRHAIFAAVGSAPALMITEGLLMYLPAAVVEALASEPVRLTGIRHWLVDMASPEMARRAQIDSFGDIEKVRAADRLDGVEILAALHRNGWTSLIQRSYSKDAWAVAGERLKGYAQAAAQHVEPLPENDFSGAHLFGHA
jgi:methyltransferase (TIGR00027 family)